MCARVLTSEVSAVGLAQCRSVYYHSRIAHFRTADPSFPPTRLVLVLFQSEKFGGTFEEVASSSLEAGWRVHCAVANVEGIGITRRGSRLENTSNFN